MSPATAYRLGQSAGILADTTARDISLSSGAQSHPMIIITNLGDWDVHYEWGTGATVTRMASPLTTTADTGNSPHVPRKSSIVVTREGAGLTVQAVANSSDLTVQACTPLQA